MSGSLSRADSFESFHAECFNVPSSTIDSDTMESTCDSVVQSAADFDLSLLGPVGEGESMGETDPVDVPSGAASCRDSMKLRL